jgi:hypothetical protein
METVLKIAFVYGDGRDKYLVESARKGRGEGEVSNKRI